MIKQLTAMPKYEAYKDSGVEWLGEIPAHWNVIRVKNVFRLVIEPSEKNNDHELLSIYTDIGVKPRKELEEKGNKASTTDGYWLVKKGDFIVNKLLAWMGAIGLSEYEGVTSPAYDILRPTKPIDGYFYHYLFRTRRCTSELKKHSRGIMEMRLRLYFDKFGVVEIPYLSKEEQTAIVTYIETRSAKIDQAISIKEQQIALLKERKQILIQNAVTRGLNPDVPMRDSGVDWIGEIPVHWDVKPVTKYATRVDYRGKTPDKAEEGIFLVTTKNIKDGKINYTLSQEFIAKKHYESVMARGLPKIGDILFTMEAPLGMSAIVDNEEIAIAQRIIKFRFNKNYFLSKFVNYSIQAGYFQDFLQREGTGSTALGIKASKLNKLKLIQPSVEEQIAIVSHIETVSAKIDQAISIQQQQLDKLKEYKATLINSAVTGKIKAPELVEGRAIELTDAMALEPVEGELVEDSMV